MVNINISIKEEAYSFLSRLKNKNKSFSDVILEFKAKDEGITRFFGVLKDVNWEEKEKAMKGLRESFNKRME